MLRLALAVVALSGCSIVGLSPKGAPAAVTTAPPIELPTHRGEQFSLASERAKRDIVLVFYRGHWWLYCKHQLGELARNQQALDQRGVTVAAISTDPSSESQTFARDYAISFPLLADVDGAVSRAYVGVNHDDTTIPGIVIIRRDGTVAFRQIAEAKYDRLTTEQLFATIDRTLGRTGATAMHGYGVLERIQVRADVESAKVGSLAVLVPLARQLAVGPMVGAHTSGAVDLDIAAVARAPLLNDTSALQLAVTAGPTVNGANDWNLGARAGVWLAVTPRWGVSVDFGARMNGLEDVDLFATLGLGVLLAWY